MLKNLKLVSLFAGCLFIAMFAFVACDDDDSSEPQIDDGFVADDGSFTGWDGWEVVDYAVYPVNSTTLGTAHGGNDPNVARLVYKHTDAGISGNEYNQGSIIVKETFTWNGMAKSPVDMGAFLGMVKRDGDFNADNAGWEYFDLGDGTAIAGRGADLMDGMCQGCHSAAAMDYVFAHPSEYAVESGSEWDFFKDATTNWQKVDSQTGQDPFLGQAHGVTDTTTIRDVYRWQPGAKYYGSEFPVGTVLLKEVYKMENNQKVYLNGGAGAWTAMVKRGGEYNSDNGYWEWFMINPETQEVGRGGDLMNNMCNGCHAQAGTGEDQGGDLVFYHPELGF